MWYKPLRLQSSAEQLEDLNALVSRLEQTPELFLHRITCELSEPQLEDGFRRWNVGRHPLDWFNVFTAVLVFSWLLGAAVTL